MPVFEPLVSICIPTFNRANTFLPGAMTIARNQTYTNLEILVSDNASSDGTPDLVKGIDDPRIRYHRQASNLGAVGNIDFCIKNSTGAYTLLLMDDDSIDPDFIESCVTAARSNPEAGLVRTGARVVNDEGRILYSTVNAVGGLDFTHFVLGWIDGKTLPFMCSTVFNTAALQKVGMKSRHHRWDDVMSEFEIAFRYGRIDIPDVKASYCIHAGELTFKEGIRGWCEDSSDLVELVCRLAPHDAPLLRDHLVPYLAALNYKFARELDESWLARLAAAFLVFRTFGVLPDTPIFRNFHTPMNTALRVTKRFRRMLLSG